MTDAAMERYTRFAIWMHWIIALLVIVNIGLAELTEDVSKAERAAYMANHKAIGITILVLSLARLVWRLGHKPPPLPAHMPNWQRIASKISHVLFYVLIIGLPLGGWLWMSAIERPVTWFGLFEVPMWPVAGNEALADMLHEGHEVGGKVMIGLIVLHLAAVAKHHFVDKHAIMRRMF